jgi:hypothetical protein
MKRVAVIGGEDHSKTGRISHRCLQFVDFGRRGGGPWHGDHGMRQQLDADVDVELHADEERIDAHDWFE